MMETRLQGIAASSGIAIGPAYCYRAPDLTIPGRQPTSPEQEMQRFAAAVQQADAELELVRQRTQARAGAENAAIFEAHHMMLHDPTLAKKVRKAVEAGSTVEHAVVSATGEFAATLAAMKDELFAARAADVRDIGRRLLRILLGLPDATLAGITVPSIVIADDLTPSDTASLDPQLTLGFCTARGGLTAHTAILARTLGIPAIVALGEGLLNAVPGGTPLVLDGQSGTLIIDPEDSTVELYKQERQRHATLAAQAREHASELAHTADGKRVEIAANIGDAGSAREAVANGAEGVGLLRTEFLYLDDVQPPSEDKQFRVYREIFETMGQRPVIVRTLDIGGDKPPSYLPFPQEMNPFLGWRAIRISLDRPELFQTQLRAMLRAAVGFQARIMFPMVSDLAELRRARCQVDEAKDHLRREGIPFAEDVPVGIMVETPAAAMLVDVLAEAADFFSLGTNDLTQYTLAVDRGNSTVASLFQPLHPSVLRLIKQTIDLGHAKGKWVGLCGELAGMRKAIPILLGLGLDEFSMSPRAIPEAKQLVRRLTQADAHRIAHEAMQLGTAAEIEAHMDRVLASL